MDPEDGRVVSNFIGQALRGEPLTVYGDGLQTRSLCYVDDMVEGLLRLMAAREVPGPVNLGNVDERTVLAIATEVLTVTRSQSALAFRPLPTDDPLQRCPDVTLASELRGWRATTPLGEGLRRTVAAWRG
jgi:UDP-glucuronate decarboxylase